MCDLLAAATRELVGKECTSEVLASTSPSRKLRVADVDAAAAAQWMILEHAFLQSTVGSSYGEHVLAPRVCITLYVL